MWEVVRERLRALDIAARGEAVPIGDAHEPTGRWLVEIAMRARRELRIVALDMGLAPNADAWTFRAIPVHPFRVSKTVVLVAVSPDGTEHDIEHLADGVVEAG